MEITEKTIFLIRLSCVIVLLTLCISVYFYGISLSCDKCTVKFKQIETLEIKESKEFLVNVVDLYDEFKKGKCLVEWIPQTGFVHKEEVDL